MWVASRGDAQSVTAEIIGWNYLKMDNIYQNFIEGEIKRRISQAGSLRLYSTATVVIARLKNAIHRILIWHTGSAPIVINPV